MKFLENCTRPQPPTSPEEYGGVRRSTCHQLNAGTEEYLWRSTCHPPIGLVTGTAVVDIELTGTAVGDMQLVTFS